MKATDYIALFLESENITCVFELVGGMITHIVDSVAQRGTTRVVSVHHEQAAAFAAEAYGRMTGRPGVAMATSGPGATNLLTGIASCYFDSVPAIFITGQVNRFELKGARAVRQLGFQETDIVSMAAPITKAAWQVLEAHELPEILAAALEVATTGRPGPVLIDIPMDVQRADIPLTTALPRRLRSQPAPIDDLETLFNAIARAERPLILGGGGIRAGGAAHLFRAFVERLGLPAVHSLMGVDLLPYHHPSRVGLIGSYGNRWANHALGRSDLLLVLGSRLDIRQTGADTAGFKAEREIYHIDTEPGEINNRVMGCHAINADLATFLLQGLDQPLPFGSEQWTGWLQEIQRLRDTWPDTEEQSGTDGINPNSLIHALTSRSQAAAAFVVDVGQHQMWAAQSAELTELQRFLTSGGMGAMGFALPAAIGATLAAGGQPVVMIAGDGGFQLNIQELQTIARNRLPVKLVVLNNQCHGMVRQFQQSYFDERYQSTLWGYSAPEFSAVAQAYGIGARTVKTEAEIDPALNWLWSDPSAPMLLQVMIDTYANAYPKIAFGYPITEMEPFVKPIAMEST